MSIDYTVVVGVDAHTLPQFLAVWPTWRRFKPSLAAAPLVVFFDRSQLAAEWSRIPAAIGRACDLAPWPPPGVTYRQTDETRFGQPQRAKMLAGFVHVAAEYVKTPYFLKLDTDVCATGSDDWIDDGWFSNDPAIVAPPWGFTKPARSMEDMDKWVAANAAKLPRLAARPPLGLVSLPGASRLSHRRICSWCAFFSAQFNRELAYYATETCGEGQLPIPSQDGAAWYVAERLGHPIVRARMKTRGWALVGHRQLERVARELIA